VTDKQIQEFLAHDGAHISKEEAQIVGSVLSALQKKLGRPLRAEDVVKEAKRKSSPIHRLKCAPSWDVRKAAEERWLEWGRYILRSVDIVVETRGEPQQTRAFPHVVTTTSRGYVPMEDVRSNVNYRASLIAQAKRDLEIWADRYAVLCKVFPKTFSAVRSEIQKVKAAKVKTARPRKEKVAVKKKAA
jgi:hypothetical protein